MKKALFPVDESERLEILSKYQILDTPSEKIFDEITMLASKICETPISLVSLIDTDRQWFKSKVGLDADETPRDISFCGHAIFNNDVFEISDAREDERFADNPLVTGAPNVVFYAGAPLISSSGHKIGTLCVIDQKSKKLTATQSELLKSLASQVINILELKLRDRELSRSLEDIHHQKNWMSSVINATKYAIIATDPEGNITTFNKGAEGILGYKEIEVMGKSPAIFHDPTEVINRAKVLTNELGWVVEVGFDVFVAKSIISETDTNEWTYIRKDGSRLLVELCVSCVKDGEEIIGFLGVATDLTEKKQAEADNQKLQAEVNLQTKRAFHNAKLATIGQMAAGVGHEINNPLGIVKGLIEMIEESLKSSGYENKKVLSIFSRVYVAVERISNITSGLRAYSRVDEAGFKNFSFTTLVSETVEMLSEIYDKEGVTLEFLPKGEDISITGNQGRLQQVLINLITNAKDATDGMKNRNILITLDTSKSHLTLLIKDNGRGIPEHIKDKIFDPFFTTKEINKGTGIGLSLVSTILSEHGGKLSFENNSDIGATFKLSLPILSEKTTVPSLEIKNPAPLKTRALEGIRVLFVDDEEDLREIVRYHLEHLGLSVETAENGKVALDILQKAHFDLILSDITMPIMDGFEFLEKFLASDATRRTKFMFITGGAVNGQEKLESVVNKIDGVLTKPFKADSIAKKLMQLFPGKK